LSDQARALPSQPNLRYLKIEAKRRLAAGEFATLHDAQLAIAREHGLPSWTALKEHIGTEPDPQSPVLTQLGWVLRRFAGASEPDWTAPGDDELREHFDEHFLARIPPDVLISTLTSVAGQLGGELVVDRQTPLGVRAHVGGLWAEASVEEAPPHRLTRLRLYPRGDQVTDPRVAAPATRTTGDLPAATLAAESLAELGLPGLALAGGAGDRIWVAACGWADLDQAEVLTADHLFPAYSVTKLVTATAVLRLAAAGRAGLDDPANEYLRTIRLADDAVTVRELLSHTGGVDSPAEPFAATVPELVTITGPVAACRGQRGTFAYSNGGYAVLGQLIADVTGSSYQDAATILVLGPLGMTASSFPTAQPGAGAVTSYELAGDGTLESAPPRICTLPAAGGLWATPADLVRFATGWASLLPGDLAREALRPQASRDPAGAEIGLGWLLHRPKDLGGHAGGGPGGAASLLVRLSDGQAIVTLASRLAPLEPVGARLLQPIG
jgi:CubicO group peptidase (beta-lactamase class C family)